MTGPVVIFLWSGDWNGRHLATSLAVTAAALGDEVHLALFGDALRLYLDGRFAEGAPDSVAAAKVPPLDHTLAEARRDLGLLVTACDTALRVAGANPHGEIPALDQVLSLPSLWRLAQAGRSLTV